MRHSPDIDAINKDLKQFFCQNLFSWAHDNGFPNDSEWTDFILRRSTGSGSECDAPRVAVEPDVLSQVARERGRRQNIRHPTRRRVIVGAGAGCAVQRSTCRGGRRTDAGAAGNNGRHFSLLKSDRTHFRIHEKWRLSGKLSQRALS